MESEVRKRTRARRTSRKRVRVAADTGRACFLPEVSEECTRGRVESVGRTEQPDKGCEHDK